MKVLRCLLVGLSVFWLYSGCLGLGGVYAATNLLSNPGAETGLTTDWTVGGNSNPGVDNGTFNPGINPNSGSFDFYGHTGSFGTLTQNVNLLSNGFTPAQIDGGTLLANVGFFEQGLNQGTPSDDASVSLTFLDAFNASLGIVSSGVVDSHNLTWQGFNGNFSIPSGTRSIDYTMNFFRNVGNDLDSYIDDNSLTVTGVPIPGAIWLLGSGLLGVVGLRRRFNKG